LEKWRKIQIRPVIMCYPGNFLDGLRKAIKKGIYDYHFSYRYSTWLPHSLKSDVLDPEANSSVAVLQIRHFALHKHFPVNVSIPIQRSTI
jgi:hypothetical protein